MLLFKSHITEVFGPRKFLLYLRAPGNQRGEPRPSSWLPKGFRLAALNRISKRMRNG